MIEGREKVRGREREKGVKDEAESNSEKCERVKNVRE